MMGVHRVANDNKDTETVGTMRIWRRRGQQGYRDSGDERDRDDDGTMRRQEAEWEEATAPPPITAVSDCSRGGNGVPRQR